MRPQPRVPKWALIFALAGTIIALAFALAGDARAQGFDRLDAHQPPDIGGNVPGAPGGDFLSWLYDNNWWILFLVTLTAAALLVHSLLNRDARQKRLQRDALEKLRRSLVDSCAATRGPAKAVWLSGGPSDPPVRLGRYAGHHRSVETVWIAYRTWFLGRARLVAANPVDVSGLDAPELVVRAISLNHTRNLGFAVPDVHNARQRADWTRVARRDLADAEAFAEEWKAYYSRAVDNALAFYDAMNAAEDRSFLRQEVTRSQDERTETMLAPAPAPRPNPEAIENA